MRNRAAEYLRQGIEEVRAAAAYLFRNDPRSMARYPSLFVRRRRKTDRAKVNGEGSGDSVPPSPVEEPGYDGPTAAEPLADPADDQPTAEIG